MTVESSESSSSSSSERGAGRANLACGCCLLGASPCFGAALLGGAVSLVGSTDLGFGFGLGGRRGTVAGAASLSNST